MYLYHRRQSKWYHHHPHQHLTAKKSWGCMRFRDTRTIPHRTTGRTARKPCGFVQLHPDSFLWAHASLVAAGVRENVVMGIPGVSNGMAALDWGVAWKHNALLDATRKATVSRSLIWRPQALSMTTRCRFLFRGRAFGSCLCREWSESVESSRRVSPRFPSAYLRTQLGLRNKSRGGAPCHWAQCHCVPPVINTFITLIQHSLAIRLWVQSFMFIF